MRYGSAILLIVALGTSALAACGGGAGGLGPNVPGTSSASGSASTDASASAAASSSSASASASASSVVSTLPPGHMKAPNTTAMGADLTAIGLDVKNLPLMAKLEPDKLRKVMKLISKSLGLQCNGCHLDDMAAATPRKKVAEKMWDDYARGFAMADGTPLFCDSCHQGSVAILDRTDKRALGKWMDASFVAKLKPKAKSASMECATCHGEDHEMHFIDLWKQGKPFSGQK
ncbi:hypothetical protein BH09MYX1_BH09MYX1_34750 [soil metagenome]